VQAQAEIFFIKKMHVTAGGIESVIKLLPTARLEHFHLDITHNYCVLNDGRSISGYSQYRPKALMSRCVGCNHASDRNTNWQLRQVALTVTKLSGFRPSYNPRNQYQSFSTNRCLTKPSNNGNTFHSMQLSHPVHRRAIPISGSKLRLTDGPVSDQVSGSPIVSVEVAKVCLATHGRQGS
jgi:hypothetical protein